MNEPEENQAAKSAAPEITGSEPERGEEREGKQPATTSRNDVEELIARSETLAALADQVAAKSERISVEFAQLLRKAAETLKKAETVVKRAKK